MGILGTAVALAQSLGLELRSEPLPAELDYASSWSTSTAASFRCRNSRQREDSQSPMHCICAVALAVFAAFTSLERRFALVVTCFVSSWMPLWSWIISASARQTYQQSNSSAS